MRSDFEVWASIQSRFDVGGGYYNPPSECVELGRELVGKSVDPLLDNHPEVVVTDESQRTYHAARLWKELSALLRQGELVLGIYDAGHLMAVHLYDEERLLQFEALVSDWRMRRVGFVALDRVQANIGFQRDFL